jgi:hypothetical protein
LRSLYRTDVAGGESKIAQVVAAGRLILYNCGPTHKMPAGPRLQFESILKGLVCNVEGAQGAIFLETDGEAIGWYTRSDPERLRLRAAYLAVLVQCWRTSVPRLNLGATTLMIAQYEGAQFVIKGLLDSYFVAVELDSNANLAEAVRLIQPAVAELGRQIAA